MAIVARLVITLVLVAGPATDEPDELAGWDAERFQAIADRTDPAWAVEPVEYPPGSVVTFDLVAADDVVGTHRRLVAASLLLDLATAAVLWRRLGPAVGRAYLLFGLPLIPLGYQRLDTLVTTLAIAGALAVLWPHPRPGPAGRTGRSSRWGGRAEPRAGAGPALAAGLLIAAGALTKVWPVLVVAGAIAIGRLRAAAAAIAVAGIGGLAWLLVVGAGLEPVDQVLSLRGATGWHVESLPGALVALFGDGEARLELNAYRIGSLRPGLVSVGRVGAVAAIAALTTAGWRRGRGRPARTLGLVVLGATSALIVTAPLLSPQFLVWLTPWAALLVADRPEASRPEWPLVLTGVAVTLTGATLTIFGPAGLTGSVPATLLTVRNLVLVALPVACWQALASPGGSGLAEAGGEGSLGHRSATPEP